MSMLHAGLQSVWRTEVSTIGQQALKSAEGAEESTGRKSLGIVPQSKVIENAQHIYK